MSRHDGDEASRGVLAAPRGPLLTAAMCDAGMSLGDEGQSGDTELDIPIDSESQIWDLEGKNGSSLLKGASFSVWPFSWRKF